MRGNSGTTGSRTELSGALADLARRARSITDVPLYAGFGISTPEHLHPLQDEFLKLMQSRGQVDPDEDILKTFINSTRNGGVLRAHQYRLSDSESLSHLARAKELGAVGLKIGKALDIGCGSGVYAAKRLFVPKRSIRAGSCHDTGGWRRRRAPSRERGDPCRRAAPAG